MPRGEPLLHVVAPLPTRSEVRAALKPEPFPAGLSDAAPAAFSDAATEPVALDLDGLFRRYAPYVAAVVHRLVGRDDDVDDTVQEVFLAAVRGLGQLRDPAAVKGWLARVAVRVARRRLQKRRLRGFFGLDEANVYESVCDAGASPEQRALLARVYRVLDQLPTNDRIAWSLRHIEGEPLDSVAKLAGCSLATAKRRIASAARTLEEAFADV